MRLLVADDEKSTRLFLKKLAANRGYEVIEAADGDEALTALTGPDPPRIAVIDWIMPRMNGVDICKRLMTAEDNLMTYRILLTNRTGKMDIVKALDCGAHDYLTKPVHPEELRSRIEVGRRLIEATDKLKELNQIKNRFLGIAAHDLRNPLGSIMNFAELLGTGCYENTPEKRNDFLSKIHQTAWHMLRLVNDLLDVSVIESGILEIRKQKTSLAVLIREGLHIAMRLAAKKNIEMTADMEPSLPDFYFDPHRMTQVIDNLLSNAVKFSPPGAAVRITMTRHGDTARVCVEDQGPGISDQQQAKLFNMYQRIGVKPTAGETSTGIGLAIVKKIIELHGGSVHVKSRQGKGSAFSFEIPIQEHR